MAVKAASTSSSSGTSTRNLPSSYKMKKYEGKRLVDMTDEELLAQAKGRPEGTRVVDILAEHKLVAACVSRAQRVSYGLKAAQGVSRTEVIRKNLINYLEGKECKFICFLCDNIHLTLCSHSRLSLTLSLQ